MRRGTDERDPIEWSEALCRDAVTACMRAESASATARALVADAAVLRERMLRRQSPTLRGARGR
jgi:hypothetical protein